MAKFQALLFLLFSLFLTFTSGIMASAIEEDRKVYIVYMGSLPDEEYSPSSHHFSLLQEVAGDSIADLLVRSYTRSFNGFAAKLTEYQSRQLAAKKEVISVFPSGIFHFQTTRSWDFLGLQEGKSRTDPSVESDVIIGVIDSGIWPESESFSDEGLSPAPKKWKGACNGGRNFTCNNKIIGARYYSLSASARDVVGHGSHTASIAAGNKVKDVSFYGLAQGTARGGVPSARIAAYNTCQMYGGCSGADVLAAFDDAIADGVDIITVSLAGPSPTNFTEDVISIGSFHAMVKGILTTHSGGNSGPYAGSVVSVAPWLLSVAASTTDRRIIDKIVLGNGKTIIGSSVNSFTLNGTNFPLLYGTNASSTCSEADARECRKGCLDSNLVTGKIVLCDIFGISTYLEVQKAGAVGAIANNSQYDNLPYVVPFPSSILASDDYDSVKSYVISTSAAEANILKSEVIKDSSAPIVASFSSRGPNAITPDIMKPDVSAPGVNILAAYSPNVPITDFPFDTRSVNYHILSGTSMAAPHGAGVAAFVKTFHPDWSPSAIKSAIMTTAWPMNATKDVDGELAYGSGHLNPSGAVDPGLVYETSKNDYVIMLCGLGYDHEELRKLTGDNSSCSAKNALPKDLNYPSMTAKVETNQPFTIDFPRTVTNVGLANSTYTAKVTPSPNLSVKVVPEVLSFSSLNEKKSFNVSVTGEGLRQDGAMVSTSLVWSDGKHNVRSPIIVHTYSLNS